MKKSVLFLLFLLSVQGLHAQSQYDQYLVPGTNNQWKQNGITFTLTEDENGKVLTIDGYNANGQDASFTDATNGFLGKKFSQNELFSDAKTIIVKNIDTFGSDQTMFVDGEIRSVDNLYIYTSVNNIKQQAFTHLYLNHVYIVRDNAHEKNNGFIGCEKNAFDFNTIVNQTGTSLKHIARLHIPEGSNTYTPTSSSRTYYSYYVGDWKEQLGMLTQEALNTCKDAQPGQQIMLKYYETDSQGGTQERQIYLDGIEIENGFQQFALTESENQIILTGSFIRTFSSNKPKKLPYFEVQGGSPIEIFDAFRISDYSYGGKPTLVSVRQNHMIPANTGVIIKSDAQISDLIIYLGDVTEEEAASLTEYPYQNNLSDNNPNLLFPSTYTNTDEVVTNGVSVGPVDRSQGVVTHRNFGLYYNSTDKYYYFSRYKPGNVPANKAYLKLTADQFPNNNEDEKGIGTDLHAKRRVRQASQSTSTDQISIDFPESKYFNFELVVVDNNLGVTTNIDKIDNITNNDKYYNLQGMEVKNPAKGVYIKNGIKIIVK